MLDQFSEVFYFIKGVVRNRWIVTIVAFIICISGWVHVSKMPDIYQSSARVHVDTRTMLRPLLRGLTVQSNVRGLVAIMRKLMFTQQNMIKVAEVAGMDVDLSSENKLHALVSKLKSKVKIQGGRSEIFTIKYQSTDPLTAKTVVQAVLTVFSEQTQQSNLSDVDSAKRFLDNQIREYEQRLQNAEKAKENYKRDNIGLLPGQPGQGQVGVIVNIRKRIEDSKVQLSELVSKKDVLKQKLTEALRSGEENGFTRLVGNDSIEDIRIDELKKRKYDILLKYTENHPNIAIIDNEIKALNKRKEDIRLVSESSDDSLLGAHEAMSNPYVQTIKVALNNIEAEIATLNSRIHSYQHKLKTEDDQFNIRLTTETEMQNLNRDYGTIRKNYMALLDRREKARMATSVDTQVSALKFKIIDPAHVPQSPSSPNRRLYHSIVLVVGFVVGIVLALLKVFVRPTMVEAKQLREITGLPVLGVISKVVNEEQFKNDRFRLYRYVFANAILLMMYSAVITLDIKL
ncbi:MAG: hypothetical protein GQ532_18550 [Methylomarinum sp.]|nr:hypothetical protein [Methylomarinum sp.]